jgi:membrane fusion protein, multidrug efflux system
MRGIVATVNRHSRASGFAIAGVLILACATLTGCKTNEAKAAATPPAPLVTVATVEPRAVPIFADFAAQTYARDTVEVRGRVTGYIEKWLFKPGAQVTAGQVLYTLDRRPYEASVTQAKGTLRQSEADLTFAQQQVSLLQAQASLSSAEANRMKAQQDYERLKPLVAADAASKQDLDTAVAALKAAEARVAAARADVKQADLSTRTQIQANQGKVQSLEGALRNAELNLQYSVIRAPISGRVGDSLVPVGGLVTPTSAQPLTTIVPLDPIWVRFQVTETEYLAWKQSGRRSMSDLPLTLALSDGTEFPHKGRIENTLNQVDPRTGTLELQAKFPNPQNTLLPGQFGRVRLQIEERSNAILVPQKAVQQLQNMQMVYAVGRDNKVVGRPITTGPRVGELWVVEQGLKLGDRIIVDGQLKVRPGSTVQPSPYKPEPSSSNRGA